MLSKVQYISSGDLRHDRTQHNCCSQKLSIIQTCPGTTRFASMITGGFLRLPNRHTPRVLVATNKNTKWDFGAGYTEYQFEIISP